jgi:hypothetical protein
MSERDQDFGHLQATVAAQGKAIEALTAAVNASSAELKLISLQMAEAKGGWRAIMFVSGISGTLGAAIVKFTPFLLKTSI